MASDIDVARRKALWADLEKYRNAILTVAIKREIAEILAKHYTQWKIENDLRDGKLTFDS